MPGSKISSVLESKLAVSVKHLRLRREHKEDYRKVAESKAVLWITIKIIWLPEGGLCFSRRGLKGDFSQVC